VFEFLAVEPAHGDVGCALAHFCGTLPALVAHLHGHQLPHVVAVHPDEALLKPTAIDIATPIEYAIRAVPFRRGERGTKP
jgi:hypothetical protein